METSIIVTTILLLFFIALFSCILFLFYCYMLRKIESETYLYTKTTKKSWFCFVTKYYFWLFFFFSHSTFIFKAPCIFFIIWLIWNQSWQICICDLLLHKNIFIHNQNRVYIIIIKNIYDENNNNNAKKKEGGWNEKKKKPEIWNKNRNKTDGHTFSRRIKPKWLRFYLLRAERFKWSVFRLNRTVIL